MVNLDDIFGEKFLKYIEEQQAMGKKIAVIASENGKTYDSIRSKVKREKNKLKDSGGVKSEPDKKELSTKSTETKETRKKPSEIASEDLSKVTRIKQANTSTDTNIDKIDTKLDFIIKLLENNNKNHEIIETQEQAEIKMQGQAIFTEVQTKGNYIKTSMRVDRDVWETFMRLCKDNKEIYKQQDLITLALKNFINAYKK